MLAKWRYERRLKRLQAERQEIEDRHRPLLKAAEARSPDDHQRALADLFHELDETNDSISELRHGRWLDLVDRYGVVVTPRPSLSDGVTNRALTDEDRRRTSAWERSHFTGRWFISKSEILRLRSAVRQEKKDRFEEWSRWLPVLSVLTSILGLVVAILALMLKH